MSGKPVPSVHARMAERIRRGALVCKDPSLTVQSAADETDINTILDRMARGVPPNIPSIAPQYGDFTSNATSYHDAMNLVIAADEAFMGLPAKVRARFDNDPALMLEFLGDEKNKSEAIELGLIARPVEDLSPATPARNRAQAGEAGGKSRQKRDASVESSNEDVEGDKGE